MSDQWQSMTAVCNVVLFIRHFPIQWGCILRETAHNSGSNDRRHCTAAPLRNERNKRKRKLLLAAKWFLLSIHYSLKSRLLTKNALFTTNGCSCFCMAFEKFNFAFLRLRGFPLASFQIRPVRSPLYFSQLPLIFIIIIVNFFFLTGAHGRLVFRLNSHYFALGSPSLRWSANSVCFEPIALFAN